MTKYDGGWVSTTNRFSNPRMTIGVLLLLSLLVGAFQNCGQSLTSEQTILPSVQNELPPVIPDDGDEPPTDPLILPPPPEYPELTANEWSQYTLRGKAQKDAGIVGGEGFQAVQSIKYAPSDPKILYLVVDTSGAWQSIDGGAHWIYKPNGFRTNGGISLGVQPTNPNVVFVAGSDLVAGYESPPGALQGILRTLNGGDSWELVKAAEITRDRRSKGADLFSFAGSNVVYAGTHSSGLLKSVDLGKTWTTLLSPSAVIGGSAMGGIFDIARHPTDPNILYMTTTGGLVQVVDKGTLTTKKLGGGLPKAPMQVEINSKAPQIIYVTVGVGGVYKSLDGGVTFFPSNSGLNMVDQALGLTISPADPNYLYVTYQETGIASAPHGFFYSHNGGSSWAAPDTMDEGLLLTSLHGAWAAFIKGHSYSTPVAAHPQNRDLAVSNHFFENPIRTDNGGRTWRYSSSGYTGSAAGAGALSPIAWDKNDRNRFFMMFHDYGGFLTNDGGETFAAINKENTFAGVLDKELLVTVTGSWTSQKIIVSRDYGKNFATIAGTDSNYRSMFLHPQNGTVLYAQNRKFTNIRTSNSFVTLTQSVWAMFPKNGNIVYSIGRHPSSRNFVVLKSTNSGGTWGESPYPQLAGTASAGNFSQMAVDPQNENRLYVAIKGVGIFVISDTLARGGTALLRNDQHGLTKDQFGSINLLSIVVDPRRPNILYSGMRAAWYGRSNGVFRSMDSGMTWSNITQKTFGPHLDTLSLGINPIDSTLFMNGFAGTWIYLQSKY